MDKELQLLLDQARSMGASREQLDDILARYNSKKKEQPEEPFRFGVSDTPSAVPSQEIPEVKQQKKSFLEYISERPILGSGPTDLRETAVLRDQPSLIEVLKENPEYGNKMVNRSVAAAKTGILLAESDAGMRSVDFEELASIQKIIQENQPEEGDLFYNKEDGFVGFMYDLARTLPESFISMGAAAETPLTAGAIAAGAGVGTVVPGVGTAVGASSGFAFATSAINEYGTTIMAMLDEEGVDVTNAQELRSAFADEELIGRIKKRAGARSGVIGLIDGISGGVAGKLSKKIVGEVGEEVVENLAKGTAKEIIDGAKSAGRKITYGEIVETSLESLAGGAGEALGSLAAGQEVSMRDVLLETLADPTSKIISIGGSKAQSLIDGVSKNLEGSGNITDSQKELLNVAKNDPQRFQDIIAASQYRNSGEIKAINAKIAAIKESSAFGEDKSLDRLIGNLQRRKANLQLQTLNELSGASQEQLTELSTIANDIEALNAKYSDGSLTGDALSAVKEGISDKLDEFNTKYSELSKTAKPETVKEEPAPKPTEEVEIDRTVFSEEDLKAIDDLNKELVTAVREKDTKKQQEIATAIIDIENKYRDSQKEAGVPSPKQEGQAPIQEQPVKEGGVETPETGRMVQELEEVTDAESFSKAIDDARDELSKDERRLDLQVSPVEPKAAKKIVSEGGKIFMSPDRMAGGFVESDGYIGGIFKDPRSKAKNVAKNLIKRALDNGGKYLDAYATKLEDIYIDLGFRPVARVPFSEEFAPDGWDAPKSVLKGKPDVVFFVYDPKNAKGTKGQGEVITDYDAAKKMAKDMASQLATPETATVAQKLKTADQSVNKFGDTFAPVVENFGKLINKLGGENVPVYVVDGATYKETTGRESRGSFTTVDGKKAILVNADKATLGTVYHEMMHAYVSSMKMSPKQIVDFANTLKAELKKGNAKEKQLAAQLDAFQKEYIKREVYGKGLTIDDPNIAEEFLSEFVGQIKDGIDINNMSLSTIDKIRLAVANFINKILNTNIDTAPIESRQEAFDFIENFLGALEGRTETLQTEEQGDSGEVGTISVPKQQIEAIDAPKASDDSRGFIRKFVTDIKLSSLNGRKFVTNMYDYTNAGITQLGNGLSINLLGGRNYVALMLERNGKELGEVSNLAAFNTKSQAEGFIRNAKEGKADLFAPHSGTLTDSWQFQHNIFEELVKLVLDNKIMGKARLMEVFNEAIKSKDGAKAFDKFNKRNKSKLKNLNSFKKDPMVLVELLNAENNYSPDLRKALNQKIASSKEFQKAIGIKNLNQFYNLIADPMNQGVSGGEIMTFVEFDPNTFKIIKTNPGDVNHHPSFGWVVMAKIKNILQPDKYYKSYDLTKEYTKYNVSGPQVSTKEDPKFAVSNVTSSAGAQPKVAKVKVKEQIDFAGIDMKVEERPASTSANIPTGGTAYVPVSTLYKLMDMREGRDEMYESAEDKKRVDKLVEAFKKEGFEYKGSDALYVDIDADGYGWIGEGNHRVLAAMKLGMTHLPVRVEFGAARDGKSLYKDGWSRVATQVVSKEKIKQLEDKAAPYYHIKYASIWETDLPTNKEPKVSEDAKEQIELGDIDVQPSVYKKNIFQKLASQFTWTAVEKQARILFESKESQVTIAVREARDIANKIRRLANTTEMLDMVSNYMEGNNRRDIAQELSKTAKGQKLLDLLQDADAMVEGFSENIVDDPAFDTLPIELKFAITNNAGTYLKTRYRFFTDKDYKIKDKHRARAIQAERDMIVAREMAVMKKAGLSEDEINEAIQNSLKDIDKRAHESIDLYINKIENVRSAPSITGSDIKIPSSSFQFKKDLPYYIQELLGIDKDPVSRFSATVQAQANILYKGRMVQGLLDMSKGMWDEFILDNKPEPAQVPFYKEVKDPYSPMNGKWVHSEIMGVFERKPLYQSDNAWFQGYFSLLKLGRKSKVIWNIPTWRKNLTGGWYFMVANGVLANPRAAKDIKDRLTLTINSDKIMTDPQTKEWIKIMGKKGLIGTNVDAQLIGINDAAYSYMYDGDEKAYTIAYKKLVSKLSNADKWLQEKYSSVDDYTKLVIFRSEVDSFAKKIYGKEYESLTEPQKDRVHDEAAEFVKQNTPTFSRLPKFYDKLAVVPIFGDFASFQFESIRSMSSNIINGVSDMKTAIEGIDKDGNKLNEEQKKAYRNSAAKRLVGTLSVFALKYAMVTGLQQLFLDEEEEEIADDAKRVTPEWMKGQSLIVKSIDKNGDVRVYNYSSEDPYGTLGDLVTPTGWTALYETFVRPNIALDYIVRAVEGEDVYGRKLFDKSDTTTDNALNFLGYTAKTFVVPPFISSSYRDVVRQQEKGSKNLFADPEQLGDLAKTIGERSIVRDYKYNILDQFRYSVKDMANQKPLKEAGDKDKRYRHLDSIREDYKSIVRISAAKENYQMANDAKKMIKRYFEKEEELYILNGIKMRD